MNDTKEKFKTAQADEIAAKKKVLQNSFEEKKDGISERVESFQDICLQVQISVKHK